VTTAARHRASGAKRPYYSTTYSLDVLKTGYEALSQVLDVNGDITVNVDVAVVPPENPDAYWLFDPTKGI
jgi:hypothetical protein